MRTFSPAPVPFAFALMMGLGLGLGADSGALAQEDDADDAPSAAPATPATDTAAAADTTPTEGSDVAALRKEYLRLRDQLFRSRARAAAVGDALYSTRLSIHLTYATGRHYAVSRASIRLDGANVYDDIDGTIATDDAPRFDGFVAPGRHVLAVHIEAAGKDDDRFTSIIANTFSIQAPAGKAVSVRLVAADRGDIPYAWQKRERGSYELRLRADVTTTEVASTRPSRAGARPTSKDPGHATSAVR
jgi:hypothetical protein